MTVRMRFALIFLLALACQPAALFAQPGRGGGSGPLRDPQTLTIDLGAAEIPDRATFEKLSYQGPMRGDAYLSDLEFVKFIVQNTQTDAPVVYWMNTQNIQAHPRFSQAAQIGRGRGELRGAVTYLPRLKTPDGGAGLYIFDFQPNSRHSYEEVKLVYDALLKTAPILAGKLAFHPFRSNVELYESEQDKYAAAKLPVHLDEDLFGNIGYLPLNVGESFGRLTLLKDQIHPSPRDIVICETLPNEMPRVAGVISAVRQTPLSHVNLRAVQDKIPNAFVIDALTNREIASLIGKFVHYQVTPQGYSLREATQAEVDAHFSQLRPSEPQTPPRDLSRTKIEPLQQIKFADSKSFGVKAANIATMLTFNFPAGVIPEGQAVPFYFYDEFMQHNGFYAVVDSLLSNLDFQADRDLQERELAALREKIEAGAMPEWMLEALAAAQQSFPAGASIRCRSSTNNEDLPGFSGAGLYDSFTHKPDEGHLAKTIKQVYASLWNFRAFEEREFYRVDHKLAAMGVLLHPNYTGELANGVAVTDDVLYNEPSCYYVNVQLGEDLVTNPQAQSAPEEILLGWWPEDGHRVIAASNQTSDGKPLMSDAHLAELRKYLTKIHGKFAPLYGHSPEDQNFAMEIEFKIDAQGKLVIKQARPWVYAASK